MIVCSGGNWLTCSNCGDVMTSFDPLDHPEWCDVCKKKAIEISIKARKELAEFGDMRRKEREANEGNDSKRNS